MSEFISQKEDEKPEEESKEETKDEIKGNKRKRHASFPDLIETKKVAVHKSGSCSQ
jgi:hypothetical protein